MNKKGFSLIELLIVVAIIAVLAGVAIPYYNDYIIDSRTSVLQNNLATIRKAINQFRADNQRGPMLRQIKATIPYPGGSVEDITKLEDDGTYDPFNELVNGPVQNIAGVGWKQRSNIKYLSSKPLLIDPATGVEIPLEKIVFTPGNCYWRTTSNEYIDIAADKFFIDSIGDKQNHPFDINPFNPNLWEDGASSTIDYIDIGILQN